MGLESPVAVIGAGLAGCECAWQLAERSIPVFLYEMKPQLRTAAHHTDFFSELVCSNSFRSDSLENAVGLLKEEMRRLGSLILSCADETRVPAGSALAVDREGFSRLVTERVKSHPLITVFHEEVRSIPEKGHVVIATGPLTSDALSARIGELFPEGSLYFFDAAAPLVTFESIDMDCAWFGSRYDRGSPDYINCPLLQGEYESFVSELSLARVAFIHEFEDRKVFEGCIPVEVMARRGRYTLCHGPMKPVGLRDPGTGREAFAVLQLRRDNAAGSLYNLVGFQTNLAFSEQKRVFSMIPALRNAEFVRFGVMHRNTYLDSPRLLDRYYRLKGRERLVFIGQMTGVEGYVESASSGLLAGIELARRIRSQSPADFPSETAIGALSLYISNQAVGNFQPMNINFGIMKPLTVRVKGKRNQRSAISARSLSFLSHFLQEDPQEEDLSL